MKRWVFGLVIACFLLGGVAAFAAPVSGNAHVLYTWSGFVEMLITRGIIPSQYADKAREMIGIAERMEETQADEEQTADPAVQVSVSQLIEHGTLTYNYGEDIKGLLLLVRNVSEERVSVRTKDRCDGVYRIYDMKDTLLYDSALTNACKEGATALFFLQPGKTQLLPVTHRVSDFTLKRGTYRFELELPGYGGGERIITIE